MSLNVNQIHSYIRAHFEERFIRDLHDNPYLMGIHLEHDSCSQLKQLLDGGVVRSNAMTIARLLEKSYRDGVNNRVMLYANCAFNKLVGVWYPNIVEAVNNSFLRDVGCFKEAYDKRNVVMSEEELDKWLDEYDESLSRKEDA